MGSNPIKTTQKSKNIKKLLVIKEICSWLPPIGLDGQNVCSQEHISLITNIVFE